MPKVLNPKASDQTYKDDGIHEECKHLENDEWMKEMLKEEGIEEYISVDVLKKVYFKLIDVAKQRGYITYEKIMDIAGINRKNKYERGYVLGGMLGGISRHEHSCGRPLLSAVVVYKFSPLKENRLMPGEGFFKLAYNLGLYNGSRNRKDRAKFWIEEINKVWNYWSKQ